MNAGLAIAMLRHQKALDIRESALRAAMGWAEWPARLQRLGSGPLRDLLPFGSELWLDGGHNPAAARAIADFFRAHVPAGRPFHLVFGLLENKDAPGVLKAFRNRALTVHSIRWRVMRITAPQHWRNLREKPGWARCRAPMSRLRSAGSGGMRIVRSRRSCSSSARST
jgi:folylpolyglutamate synthase/dihydropteroate synthase